MKTVPKILMTTNVGSHMWKMSHPGSDTDLFHIYLEPSDNILIGRPYKESYHETETGDRPSDTIDNVYHELAKVIRELQKGNVNFIWGVLSPIYLSLDGSRMLDNRDADSRLSHYHLTNDPRPHLRQLGRDSLSKKCYHSIRGLALSNYKKYIFDKGITNPRGLPDWKYHKKLKLIARTLIFGIKILQGKGVIFDAVGDVDKAEVERLIDVLEGAFSVSNLPEECPNKEDMENWLLQQRLKELEKNNA